MTLQLLTPGFTKPILFSFTVFLAACVAPGESSSSKRLPNDAEVEQYNAMVAPEERIVCRVETPIHSRIPQRTCRLVRDMQETSLFHREQLRQILR